jgi:hypothetical protein
MERETGIEPATSRLGKPAFYFRDFCYFSGRKGLTPNPINLSNLAILTTLLLVDAANLHLSPVELSSERLKPLW